MGNIESVEMHQIQSKIYTIRGLQVMIDSDLAEFYGVATKVMNQAVKRNKNRFPEEFIFRLTINEKNELVTNCDRFAKLKHSATTPYAFTEQGVAMLSAVLKSEVAVKVSVQIINAFVAMRKFLTANASVFKRLDNLETKQLETDKKIDNVLNAIESREVRVKQGIFFDGQIFDAYKFVSDIVRTAKSSIILIDNYVDDTVLTLFSKRNKNIPLTILTKNISKQLKLDVEKYNQQYPIVEIKEYDKSHDRFLIIDNKTVYHFGASLKDLGKKIFAFSKLEIDT
ncbi:ORF6N domain-containing protein, partial [Candidatus Dependentiae bacterium]|nr:ORF6N domain-containing protein [Candidatus Dependentiae bacterium]